MAEKFKVGVEALGLLYTEGLDGYEIGDDVVLGEVHNDSPYFVSIAAVAAVVAAVVPAATSAAAAAGDTTTSPVQMELDGDAATGPAEPANRPAAVAPPNAKLTGPPDATVRLFCRYRRGEAGEPLTTSLQATVQDLVAQVRIFPRVDLRRCHGLCLRSRGCRHPIFADLPTLCVCRRRRCRCCVALQARETLKISADLQLSLSTATSSLDGRSQATIAACGAATSASLWTLFPRSFKLDDTLHAPCAVIYLVPMLIVC